MAAWYPNSDPWIWNDAMNWRKYTVNVTTAADGTATYYSPRFSGVIRKIIYRKISFDAGVGFTITGETSLETIWAETPVNASKNMSPVEPAQIASTGVDSTKTEQPIALVKDRVKIVIAGGGNAKAGTFHIIVG